MRAAYRSPDPLAGQGDLEALARELDQPTAERRARIHWAWLLFVESKVPGRRASLSI